MAVWRSVLENAPRHVGMHWHCRCRLLCGHCAFQPSRKRAVLQQHINRRSNSNCPLGDILAPLRTPQCVVLKGDHHSSIHGMQRSCCSKLMQCWSKMRACAVLHHQHFHLLVTTVPALWVPVKGMLHMRHAAHSASPGTQPLAKDNSDVSVLVAV